MKNEDFSDCGSLCTHDLECPSVQKCCQTEQCGSSCVNPKNVTECFHQKVLSELLAVSERAGRGYVPQCSDDGQFEPKQCSRNGLVCWCVDRMGRKLRGSMGSSELVNCSTSDGKSTIHISYLTFRHCFCTIKYGENKTNNSIVKTY